MPPPKPKILVIRFSSIGDIVLTTPVVRTLKLQKNAEVHYCTKAVHASLMRENPYVDKVHVLKDKLRTLIVALQKERYDYLIDLHHNRRSWYVKRALGVKAYSFHKLNIKKFLLTTFKWDLLPPLHIVDRYMQTVAPLGVQPDDEGLEYYIPPEEEVSLEKLPPSHRHAYVAYAMGGTWATKRLPLEKMVELCEHINRPIVLLGGEEDAHTGQALQDFFEKERKASAERHNTQAKIFNGCGKFSLHGSASLVRQASYVFAHDTGLMHIAAAFKKQVFVIWGNTVPQFGMYPYKTSYTSLENPSLFCRPCSKIGYLRCPRRHFKCMNDIRFDFSLAPGRFPESPAS